MRDKKISLLSPEPQRATLPGFNSPENKRNPQKLTSSILVPLEPIEETKTPVIPRKKGTM